MRWALNRQIFPSSHILSSLHISDCTFLSKPYSFREPGHAINMADKQLNDGEELWAVADLCLIPMGVADPSVGPQIAEVSRLESKISNAIDFDNLCFIPVPTSLGKERRRVHDAWLRNEYRGSCESDRCYASSRDIAIDWSDFSRSGQKSPR